MDLILNPITRSIDSTINCYGIEVLLEILGFIMFDIIRTLASNKDYLRTIARFYQDIDSFKGRYRSKMRPV